MKHLLIFTLLIVALPAQAEQHVLKHLNAKVHGKQSALQWGLDAVNIPKIINPVNAEIIGLKPTDDAFFNRNLLIKAELSPLDTAEENQLRWHSEHTNVESFITSEQHVERHNYNNQMIFGVAGNRFSAETKIAQSSWQQDEITSYQFQGAYKLYKQGNLSLTLTAKIEWQESSLFHQKFHFAQPALTINLHEKQQVLNSTLGLITTLHLTENWQLYGTVSAHNIKDKDSERLFISDQHVQRATIATRYSF